MGKGKKKRGKNGNNNNNKQQRSEYEMKSPRKMSEDERKRRLETAIENRPHKSDLVQRNIMKSYPVPADPKLHSVLIQVDKSRAEDKLKNLLEKRSTAEALQRKNILHVSDLHDPKVSLVKKKLQKQNDMDRLNKFLDTRPTLQDIVNQNIVEDTMTWTREITSGSTPLPRNCHTMTCIDETLYLIGGFGTNSRSLDIMSFDTNTQMWARPMVGGMIPIERYSHTTVAVGSQLLVFGGFSDSHNCWMNDLNVLDTEFVQPFIPSLGPMKKKAIAQNLLMWYEAEVSGDLPCARAAHSCVVLGSKIYVFAGNDGSLFFNDLYELDTETFVWKEVQQNGDLPCARAGHSACMVDENEGNPKMVVFGGGNNTGPLNDLYIYDFNTSTWSCPNVMGTPPSARAGHTACRAFTSCILVFAGGFLDKIYNDLHMFDVKTNSWSRPSDTGIVPLPRTGHTCTVMGTRLYVFGGGDSDHVFNDLHALDTAFLHLGSMRRRNSLSSTKRAHDDSGDDNISVDKCSKCIACVNMTRRIRADARLLLEKVEELMKNITNHEDEQEHKIRTLIRALTATSVDHKKENDTFRVVKNEIELLKQNMLDDLNDMDDDMNSHGSSASSSSTSPKATIVKAKKVKNNKEVITTKTKPNMGRIRSSSASEASSTDDSNKPPPAPPIDGSTRSYRDILMKK